MAHSPGPWTAKYLPQHRMRVIQDENISICDIALWNVDYDEQMANARLIAAAPELLASCRSLIEALELIGRDHAVWWPHDGDLVVRARAAIAKAEGRS